jgi:isopentenyl-diphosphate Delta-isomerase
MSVSTQLRMATEHVVLLDERGRPTGTRPKSSAHGPATPFHLAFSCHLVDAEGRVLLTRRAPAKRTWPGIWTNGCCGHPQMGETLRQAVTRRVIDELGLSVGRIGVALPDFAYRALMSDGTVEHELCPVVVAEVAGAPMPDPDEVDGLDWCAWDDLCRRARTRPDSLSPWSVEQIAQLAALAPDLRSWLHGPHAQLTDTLLDEPVGAPQAVDALPVVRQRDGALAVVDGPLRAQLDGFVRRAAATTMAVDPVLGEVTDEIQASSTGVTGPPGPRTTTPCWARRPRWSCCTPSPSCTTT